MIAILIPWTLKFEETLKEKKTTHPNNSKAILFLCYNLMARSFRPQHCDLKGWRYCMSWQKRIYTSNQDLLQSLQPQMLPDTLGGEVNIISK